jgi:hypothetical protein
MCSIRIVDLSWPPEEIKEFCENNDGWLLMLDSGLTPADIDALYRRQLTVPAPYEGVISEIAEDTRTPQWVLEDIVTRFASSLEVMASLATNSTAPVTLLERLQQHEDPDVRLRAELSLRPR